jgi:hypothetical protein
MRLVTLLAGAAVLSVAIASPLHAQDEGRLRKALEGKRITLKMDMPATSEGVDVYPGSSRGVDFDKVGKRMKKHGIALRDGESARITKVKVKDNLIEIQLNGGGFGTFGDALRASSENRGADSGIARQMKNQNMRNEKAAAGSRFNLRYPNGVDSDDMTAAAVIRALDEYAGFPEGLVAQTTQHSSSIAASAGSSSSSSMGQLRKGMSMEEVEQVAGTPTSSKMRNNVTTNIYKWQGGVLEADFYAGVLVAYRMSME